MTYVYGHLGGGRNGQRDKVKEKKKRKETPWWDR